MTSHPKYGENKKNVSNHQVDKNHQKVIATVINKVILVTNQAITTITIITLLPFLYHDPIIISVQCW